MLEKYLTYEKHLSIIVIIFLISK